MARGRSKEAVWDGIVRSKTLSESSRVDRHGLADAAKNYDWQTVGEMLCSHPELMNTTRPDGSSFYAPLHQVAHGGAPIDVALKLIALGAWRTLQNARGERPVDVAERRGHTHLVDILTPDFKRRVPMGVLSRMQSHFHAVIRGRVKKLVQKHGLRLPELEPLLEFDQVQVWFAVPGMAGGFSYRLEGHGANANLVSESWCRVVGGSGERHEITSAGGKLVAEGFV